MPTFDVSKLTPAAINAYNNNAFGDLNQVKSWADSRGMTLEEAMNQLAVKSATEIVATTTQATATQPTYTWEQLAYEDGGGKGIDIKNLPTTIAGWNTYLRQGEKAAFRIDFKYDLIDKVNPNQEIAGVTDYAAKVGAIVSAVKSSLVANGVTLWKPIESMKTPTGGAVIVYYEVGILPVIVVCLIVVAIAALIAVVVTILAVSITYFRLKQIEVTAAVDRAQETTSASVNRQDAAFDKAMTAISALPADQQVTALTKLLSGEQAYAIKAETTASKSTSAGEGLTGMLKTPITIFVVMLGLGIIVYAVLKSGRI